MKTSFVIILFSLIILSCNTTTLQNEPKGQKISIQGTWKLLKGITIQNNDSTITDYTTDKEFIKIINETHFAFLSHDLKKGKDSSAIFSAGGGTYNLTDSLYTENLEYCNDRQWEGNKFEFTVSVKGDTLTQQGIEKVENIGVNRVNIEKYIKIKNQ